MQQCKQERNEQKKEIVKRNDTESNETKGKGEKIRKEWPPLSFLSNKKYGASLDLLSVDPPKQITIDQDQRARALLKLAYFNQNSILEKEID